MREFKKFNQREKNDSQIGVRDLSEDQLQELFKYLLEKRINIDQKLLQSGVVSEGYKKFGVIELTNGKIGFRPGQHNHVIVGTPKDFSEVLRKFKSKL
ncbi:MAG: hypothetical protein WC794_01395 [Candidatus Doudnabacteria bacterium]|jgi:hypothetical protein